MGWKPGCSDHQRLRKTFKSAFSPTYFFAVSSEASWSLGLGAGDRLSICDSQKVAPKEQKHKVGEDSPTCRADGVCVCVDPNPTSAPAL